MLETAKIRELNDTFRRSFIGGHVVTTIGVANSPKLDEVLQRVRDYNGFTPDNDSHLEHGFGAFEINGQSLLWKLDYYTVDLDEGSPNPADETVTTRVLTIMLAEEY